jgi:glycosyltransferase involved in cell wall biosynthesis
MNSKKPNICVVAHNSYGVLTGVDTGHNGGIEVQTPLLAKWLAKNGFTVSIVTWDEGLSDAGEVDGVKIIKLCKRDDGVRVIRFFHPRWTSLIGALNQADADIYYYNCGDLALGQIALWARNKNKKLVYSVASERDCYKDLQYFTSARERVLYRYGLRRTDSVIVQTNKQKELLKAEYNIESTMIRMPCDGFEDLAVSSEERLAHDTPHVLWVGRLSKEKRTDWMLDIAEACPDIHIDIVGAENAPTAYSKSIYEKAKSLNNVTLHGRVPHSAIGEFYKNSALLCSTSVFEGFPNVYLEAWSTGLPIVSTFDPDNLIKQHSLGKYCESKQELIESIKSLLIHDNHERASKSALSYYQMNHTVEISMNKFSDLFIRIA